MASHEIDLSTAVWRRSSYSNGTGGECVEVAHGLAGLVPVRDSKLTAGPTLVFPATAWAPFVTAIARHEPDRT